MFFSPGPKRQMEVSASARVVKNRYAAFKSYAAERHGSIDSSVTGGGSFGMGWGFLARGFPKIWCLKMGGTLQKCLSLADSPKKLPPQGKDRSPI